MHPLFVVPHNSLVVREVLAVDSLTSPEDTTLAREVWVADNPTNPSRTSPSHTNPLRITEVAEEVQTISSQQITRRVKTVKCKCKYFLTF